ncbi:MAG: hypothetical protein HKN07_13835 [Acidimicrobiia bacterium]|nr:DUF3566 domain-containing protein [Acidimicrobiia bacterium]NNF65324.1 hypothetical protein [Acidimicrobiia bacterium]
MAVRRVRRVVRKIDPWTVLKVSFVFNVIAALAFVLGTWVMWSIVVQRGIPQQIADLADNLTVTFTPDGELYFRIVVLLAVVWVVSSTALLTLGSVLYNLISDVVGGLEIVVLEETYNLRAPVPQPVPNNVRPAVHQTRPVATVEPVPERVPARANRSG